MKKSRFTIEGRRAMTGRLFILPFTLGFLMFFLVPAIQSLIFSFNTVQIDIGRYNMEFIGLENFKYWFTEDADFNKNLMNSLRDMLIQAPVVMISALFFAIIINQKFHGRTVVRAIFFLPVIIASGVVMSIISSDSFASSLISSSTGMEQNVSANSFGLQELLISMGLAEQIVGFFTGIASNLFDLMWRTGIQMIIFLAALQTISPTLYEASSIEGASAWENFWMVTIPMIVPMILVNTIYTIVDTFTNGTNIIMETITSETSAGRYGRSSAASWTYFLIIGIVLAVTLLVFTKISSDKTVKEGRR